MSDSLDFLKPWPCIKLWRQSVGLAGATVRSAARTSLFQSFWRFESKGRFSAWPAFALACSRPSYCCCCCLPGSPNVLPFIYHHCFQTLPKGSLPAVGFAKAGTMCRGESALELRSLWTLLARDWSCSQSCAQAEFNAWAGMWSNVLCAV